MAQQADRPLAELELFALVAERERDVQPLVVLGRGVADAASATGTSSSGTSMIEPSSRSIRTSTAWAASPRPRWTDRYTLCDTGWTAMSRMHDVAGLAAEERADPGVDVVHVERLRPGSRASVGDVDGEHLRRGVVGHEQDPVRPEGDWPRRPDVRPADLKSISAHGYLPRPGHTRRRLQQANSSTHRAGRRRLRRRELRPPGELAAGGMTAQGAVDGRSSPR